MAPRTRNRQSIESDEPHEQTPENLTRGSDADNPDKAGAANPESGEDSPEWTGLRDPLSFYGVGNIDVDFIKNRTPKQLYDLLLRVHHDNQALIAQRDAMGVE